MPILCKCDIPRIIFEQRCRCVLPKPKLSS
jgi:hypothetical protein